MIHLKALVITALVLAGCALSVGFVYLGVYISIFLPTWAVWTLVGALVSLVIYIFVLAEIS